MPERALSVDQTSDARTKGIRRAEILETAARMFAISGMRTSLKEIGDECGILPGSLYFHFKSKEALIIELICRYQADLDRVAADALEQQRTAHPAPLRERVMQFGQAIAGCAVRHPAALLMTLYEPPTGASDELRRVVGQAPTAIHDAMLEILQSNRDGRSGVRAGIDPALLGDRLCESMMRHGVADFQLGPQAQALPDLRCRILLDGLATSWPDNAALDTSPALRAAKEAASHWNDGEQDDERAAHLLRVARREFSRRGYGVTTLRDIAAASGISAGTAYRLFPSKENMLGAIIDNFETQRNAAWDAVLNSPATPLEKLDALLALHVRLQERFSDEIRIQFRFVLETPLNKRRIATPSRLHDLECLLEAGVQSGQIRPQDLPISLYARCVYEAFWTPEGMLREVGPEASRDFARNTVLAGAFDRETP
jgi:AcrR family transcriptional regulator